MTNIRELPSKFKYYLAYAEENGQLPTLYGYEDMADRDNAYKNYLVTGELEIFDILYGTFRTLQPTLMGKVDLVTGNWLFTDTQTPLH